MRCVCSVVTTILFSFSIQCLALTDQREFAKGKAAYSHAKSGLVIRKQPGTGFRKLSLIPHGEVFTVLDSRTDKRLQVEGIHGYWLRVLYKGVEGYVFSGFVSRYPVPAINRKSFTPVLRQYADFLKKKGFTQVKFAIRKLGPPNHNDATEETLVLNKASMLDGYLLARVLFQIPASVKIPKVLKEKQTIVEDKNKPDDYHERMMGVNMDDSRKIVEITFFERGSGWNTDSAVKLINKDTIKIRITADVD